MKVDGVTLTSIKDQMNADEIVAYSDYEFVFKVDTYVKRTATHLADFSVFAQGGVDPLSQTGVDVQLDFAARGVYASTTNTDNAKTGSVQDNTGTRTAVFNLDDVTLQVG